METAIRIGAFVCVFAIVAIWEVLGHRRALRQAKGRRWAINLGIILTNVVVQRLTVGALAFATALHAREHGWGLFNWLDWPGWIEGLLAFLILDFAIYLQHVMSHALPIFWRLHQVHHADLDVDLTTGLRFHPVEILISMLYKALVVAAIGADPWAVLVFEAVLNGSALYTHGNVRMPGSVDRALRLLFCTPDMHRVHHSIDRVETNSNFGFFLSIWDRLCGTMRDQPKLGHDGVILGLEQQRDPARLGYVDLLLMPAWNGAADYSASGGSSVVSEKTVRQGGNRPPD